jgi:hypothetical protein
MALFHGLLLPFWGAFSSRIRQITTFLPSDRIYGFGKNAHQKLEILLEKVI